MTIDAVAVEPSTAPSPRPGEFERSARRLPGLAPVLGIVLLTSVVLLALFAPWLASHPPDERSGLPYQRPGGSHLLGTDDVGNDLFAQLAFGARTSLLICLGVGLLSTLIGVLAGSTAAVRGGLLESFLMRSADVVLVLPFLPLLIAVAAVVGRDLATQIIVISALTWARPARLIRAQTSVGLQRGHTTAAVAAGATRWWLLWRHASRDVAPLLIPVAIRAAMAGILIEASLAFLGLGDPQRTSWGTMLFWANARSVVLTDAWKWWVIPPGLAIAAVVLGLSLVGLAAEERLNPTLRARGIGAGR
jgi:peptide/nickel transport system permease protein